MKKGTTSKGCCMFT